MTTDQQYLLSVGYPAEPKRHRYLDEQADRRKSIAGQTWIAKALDDRWAVGIETARRSTIQYTDHDMDPEQPIRKLEKNVRRAFPRKQLVYHLQYA
jgi:hypothetical protein